MAEIPAEKALAALPDKLLVGVSGGIDSVALLHALVQAGKKPIVLHVDHGWRVESMADADAVEALAKKLKLKFLGGKIRGTNVQREAAARAGRYEFFAKIAKRLKIPDLVLAHNADDQVETYLLQLLRGTGAAGRGMDPVTKRDGMVIHRPWLGVWRREIKAYALRNKLDWREDSTNADPRYRRNLLRRQVIPYLQKQFGKQVAENLFRAAEIARAEGEWLDDLCKTTAKELSVKTMRGMPLAQQRRIILRWLQSRDVKDISFVDVEAVRGLLENRVPAKVNLSNGRHARRREGKIFVE